MKMMTWSGHNFAPVMTAQLPWQVQNCDLIGWLELKLKENEFTQDFSYVLINRLWNGSLIHIMYIEILCSIYQIVLFRQNIFTESSLPQRTVINYEPI